MYGRVKRILDFLAALTLLIVLSPVLLAVAAAVGLESRGGVLFRQQRLGRDGRAFTIYKFRSMVSGAEGRGTGVYSYKGDARVTRVGRFIRATSLDELPQLINILRGEMSVIGPRPPLTYHPWPLGEYTREQRRRFDVRPGITGWAQVHGRKEPPWEVRIGYDIEYVDNMRAGLDAKILVMTAARVLLGRDNLNVEATVSSGKYEQQASRVS